MSQLKKTKRIIVGVVKRLFFKPTEAWLVFRLAFWVMVISVAARQLSLPRALKLVATNTGPNRPSRFEHEDQIELAHLLDLILSTNILVFKPVCWKRAAVLHRFLALRGVETAIRFGVRTEGNGKIDGHAWLEVAGIPILEKTPPDYIVTYTFPSNEKFSQAVAFSLE